MKKRILSIVLAIAMLAMLVPVGIFASAESTAQLASELTISDTIDSVDVFGYVAPTVGGDIAENLAGLTVPEGAHYSISSACWYNETLDNFCMDGSFIAGYTYRLNVDIFVDSGYIFADDLVMQFNGDASLVDRDFYYCYADAEYAYLYSVATQLEGELITVDTVNANGYVAPTAGADIAENLAGLSVPEGAPYSISEPYWYNETLDRNERYGTFIAGYTYRLRVRIDVASGCVFADDIVMQLNGDASLVDLGNSRFGKAYVRLFSVDTRLEGELITVDTVNVNGYIAPTVGADIAENLAGLTAPDGAPYSINPYWYNETLDSFCTEGTFIAGYTYRLNVDIYVDSGYIFADYLVMQFNGDASLVDRDFGYCYSDAGSAYLYSVATELSAEGGEEGGDTPTEPTPVDLVNFNGYVAPTVGADIADSLAGLSVPSDAPYSIAELHWLDETTNEMLTEGTFLAGHIYSLGVAFNLADGYALAEAPTFQLNGDSTLVNQLASGAGDEFGFDFFYYSVSTELPSEGGDTPTEPTEKIEIDSVDISGITAPTHGQTVADYKASLTLVLPEGANYSVTSITITEINPETLGIIDMLADGDVFDSSKTYSVGILVEAGDGYVFATDAVITANGGEYEPIMTLSDGDKAGVAVAFTPDEGSDEPIVIDTINVNGYGAPTAGANIADNLAGLSVPADAPYSIVNAHWYNDTLEDTAYEETFVAGYSYSLCVEIKLADGYVLAAEWTEQLNGNAALVDSQYSGSGNEETDYDLYYYSLITELPSEGGDEPGEKTEIDKIEISGITAPEYGKTVADYKASFVPVLPEGANYTFDIIEWAELNPETMAAVSTEMLADDHVFDASKIYSAMIAIKANDGYVFADDAVITINGGDLEVFKFMPIENQAVIAIAFNPDTKPVEIDKIEISGVTAPEYGKTVADYKASFVPVLPDGANYTFAIMAWIELDPETMTAVSTEVLADDHVFDSTKTYGALIGIRANDGYVFADDAVITVNGGELEIFESMAIKDQALIGIAFNPAPDTGDSSTIAVFAIVALASIGCVALTLRKKED